MTAQAKTAKLSDILWAEYIAAKKGGSLADLNVAEMVRAMSIHEAYVRALDAEDAAPIRVSKLNTDVIRAAIDAAVEEYETADGETVTIGKTYVEGSRTALEYLANAVIEGAQDNAEARYAFTTCTAEFRENLVARATKAAYRAAAMICQAAAR